MDKQQKYENKIIRMKGFNNHTNYNPIILDGKVYKDSIRRVYKDQGKRLDYIDYKNKRVVDIGCYNGFLAIEAMNRGAKSYLGIDSNSQSDGIEPGILSVARVVAASNNLKNVSFKKGWCKDLRKLVKLKDFDIVTVLSISDANWLFNDLQKGEINQDWYNFVKEKIVYIEPCNHGRAVNGKKKPDPPYTKVQLRAQLKKAIKNSPDINIEFLTFTEYENRILLRLTSK